MDIVRKTICRADGSGVDIGKVQIYSGGADAAVPQQFLDRKEVGSVLQQMCGECVAQAVYGYFLGNSRNTQPLIKRQIYRCADYGRQIFQPGKSSPSGWFGRSCRQ